MSSSACADGLIVPAAPPPNICFSSPFIPGPADVHSSSPALILPRAEHSSPPSKTGSRVPFLTEILLFSFTFSPSVLIFTPSLCRTPTPGMHRHFFQKSCGGENGVLSAAAVVHEIQGEQNNVYQGVGEKVRLVVSKWLSCLCFELITYPAGWLAVTSERNWDRGQWRHHLCIFLCGYLKGWFCYFCNVLLEIVEVDDH